MSQNPFAKKVKIYTFSALALTLMAIALRVLNFLLIYDPITDYFAIHPLHTVYLALCIFTAMWLLSALFLIPRKAFPANTVYFTGLPGRVASAICALGAAASFFFFRDCMVYYVEKAGLYNLLAICSILAALYFAFEAIGAIPSAITALAGYLVLLWLGLILSVTYLDLYVAMNSPFKISLHLGLLGMMLHVLESIRFRIGRPFRLTYYVYTLIAAFLCGTASIPVLVAYFTNQYPNVDYLFYGALMLLFFLYLCIRAADCHRALVCAPAVESEDTPDNTEQAQGGDEHVS